LDSSRSGNQIFSGEDFVYYLVFVMFVLICVCCSSPVHCYWVTCTRWIEQRHIVENVSDNFNYCMLYLFIIYLWNCVMRP